MKRNIRIVCNNFWDFKNSIVSVGGIQTYICNLCNVIKGMGHSPIIYQEADENFVKEVNGVTIKGIMCKKHKKKLSRMCKRDALADDIVIFATESLVIPVKNYSIAIQHGIAWDKPEHMNFGSKRNHFFVILRGLRAFKRVSEISTADEVICVDYNFVNWYRTQVAHQDIKLTVIPNFAEITEYEREKRDTVNIIFARRFFPYRGTRIFVDASKKILSEYKNVRVTVSGSGPDEEYLRRCFKNEDKVNFLKFEARDSISIHKKHDISIVPTLGSEGTSLSLLEAMAAGCAVVATNVGGMTNIVLNGYNGLLINADSDSLYDAIKYLIDNEADRNRLAQKGYETVSSAFSYEHWKNNWEKVLNRVLNN